MGLTLRAAARRASMNVSSPLEEPDQNLLKLAARCRAQVTPLKTLISSFVTHGSAPARQARRVLSRCCAAFLLVVAGASAAQAQTVVTATWDRNTDTTTAGYRVYYGTSPGSYQWSVDAGNQVSAPLSLTPGTIYYVAVRAYNADYEYGPPSSDVSVDLARPTASISAVLQANNVALVTWSTTNAATAVINGYTVQPSGSTTVTVSATTTFTLTATSASGVTATASATVTLGVAAAPTAPLNLSGTVSGARVSLAWRAPSGGGTPQTYLIYAGTTSGGTNVANGVSVGNVLSAYGDLPKGRYYVRMRARNASGTSPYSNTVQLRVGRSLAVPSGFRVTWVGTTATLSWTTVAGATAEDTPTNFVLEAGSAAGLSDVASVSLGTRTSFSADVSQGTYYVRVRATNDYGDSDPTADLVLIAPGAPNAPSAFMASGSGSTVDLRWTAPRGGEAPTSYVIEAGTAPGLSDVGRLPVGNVVRFSTVAAPGVYYVRVRAVNAKGAGEASNEVVVRR
jgi:hypothetical protein